MDPANHDMKPVRDWLEKKNGKIAYSDTHKFKQEWKGRVKTFMLNELIFADKLKIVNRQRVEAEISKLKSTGTLKSNDEHIIALAIVTEVKVLISEDRELRDDFKKLVGGKIYQQASHKHLLRRLKCP